MNAPTPVGLSASPALDDARAERDAYIKSYHDCVRERDHFRALLDEGQELSLSNQRAAAARRRLFDWGERVRAALKAVGA